VPLTRRIVHHFLHAPDDYAIEHALRWGQMHAAGGGPRLVAAVLQSQLGRELGNEDFWQTVLRFLVENPSFPLRYVPLLVRYLSARKFEHWEIWVDGELCERRYPPQPHLSMTRRSVTSLLRQIVDWQRGVQPDGTSIAWQSSGLHGFERRIDSSPPTLLRIRELLSATELREEGRALRNCVASYAASCAAGRCSIWSLEEVSPKQVRKRQTLEICDDRIVQSRGPCNRLPRDREREVILAWAEQQGLAIEDPLLAPPR
jgi:hypothetical protein